MAFLLTGRDARGAGVVLLDVRGPGVVADFVPGLVAPLVAALGVFAVQVALVVAKLPGVGVALGVVAAKLIARGVHGIAVLGERGTIGGGQRLVAAALVGAELPQIGPALRLGAVQRAAIAADFLLVLVQRRAIVADFLAKLAKVLAVGRLERGRGEGEKQSTCNYGVAKHESLPVE